MALVLADRVRDTTTTTGTGTVTLSGTAPTGYQNFSVVGNGNTTYYTINAASQWEVGIGTYSSTGPTLSRDTVLASSNAGSLVNFSSGTKDVFITYPAEKSVNQNGSVISAGSAVLGVANGGTGATSLSSGYVLKGNGTSAVSASVIYDDGTNVGVGTPSPGAKLDVAGNSYFRSDMFVYQNGGIFFNGNGSYGGAGVYARNTGADLVLAANGGEGARLTATGFGVGVSSPSVKFSASGSAGDPTLNAASGVAEFRVNTTQMLAIGGYASGSYGMWLQGKQDNGGYTTSTWPIILQPSGGNVGVGTPSPGVKLDVTGSIRASQSVTIGGGGTYAAGSIYSDGNWGMIFRAYQASPNQAQFLWTSSADSELLRIDTAGSLISTFSVRAPIFYDNNNTAYYLDPASTSNLGQINFGDSTKFIRGGASGQIILGAGSASDAYIQVGGSYYPIWNSGNFTPGNYMPISGGTFTGAVTFAANVYNNIGSFPFFANSGSVNYLYTTANGLRVRNSNDSATPLDLTNGGSLTASADMRAPIFYDSNNTAYYVDPANTSYINTIQGSQYSVGLSNPFDAVNGSPWYGLGSAAVTGHSGSASVVQLAGYYGLRLRSQSYTLDVQCSTGVPFLFSDYGQFGGSVRAPIFYDSDNTAYYVDPAGTSNLNVAQAITLRAMSNTPGNYGGISSSWAGNSGYPTLYGDTDDRWVMLINPHISYTQNGVNGFTGSMTGSTIRMAGNPAASTYWDIGVGTSGLGADVFGIGRAAQWNSYWDSSGNVWSRTSHRAPIYYDSDNTGYYVDPASTSYLNVLNVGSGGVLGSVIIFNNMNNNHGTYQDANSVGDFGFRYLQGPTNGPGISGALQYYGMTVGLGAEYSYSQYGSQFYWPRTPLGGAPYISVRFREGGSWGSWSKIYAGWADAPSGSTFAATGDFRAPIFYDSNNTAYYVDPAGNSVFSSFNIGGGEVYVYGSATNALGIRTGAGGAYKYFNFDASGNFYALNGSVYGVQFYDQNNTAYYLDPDGTSNLNRLLLQPRIDNYYVGSVSSTDPVSDWQSLTNTTGQFVVSQFNNFGAGGFTNYPSGVYTYGAVLSWRTTNHSFQLYASHTGDLAYKTQWQNDNYSGWLTPVVYGRNAGSSSGKTIFGTVYYDADDSSYYINPNGNSVIVTLTAAGTYGRSAAGTGFLDGRYGGVETNYTTGPIYCISTSYAPSASSLNSMYGIGYTDGANSGVWSGGGWGLYVAAGSGARVFLDGSNGIASATASLRAPIFYDSNNTAYYVDPASTAANCAYFAGGIHISGANVTGNGLILADDGDIVDMNDGYCSMRFSLGVLIRNGNRSGSPAYELNSVYGSSSLENQRGFVINGNYTDGRYSTRLRKWDDGGGVPLYVQQTTGTAGSWANVASFGASNSRYTFHVDGIMYTASDVRASQFVDANDTSYYVDPAGTSLVNRVVLTNGFGAQADGTSNDPYGFISVTRGTGANYSYYGLTRAGQLGMGMGIDTSNQFWIGGTTAGYNATRSSTWFYMNTSGDVWAPNSFRAPVFYDSANTSYYVDPAGDTVLAGNLFISQASSASYIYMGDTDNGQRVIHNNSDRIGFLNQSGGWGSYCNDDGSWQTDFAVYAPVYYDLNNTAYYIDPAGTSVLGGLLIGRTSTSTDVNAANDTGSFSVRGDTTKVAAISFHRTNAYAINMGLGTDNVFRIGGWSASSNCFQMDGSGNLTMLGNVTAYSDARLKKDVETIEGALDLVSKMRGVRFTRVDSEERGTGVIAQEMLEVMPEVVQQGVGEDDTLSVAYGNLVGVLIEAVKELTARVAELEGK